MLNQKIVYLIESDDSFNKRQEKLIKDTYEKATAKEKEKNNSIFVALTGYSFQTILNKEI